MKSWLLLGLLLFGLSIQAGWSQNILSSPSLSFETMVLAMENYDPDLVAANLVRERARVQLAQVSVAFPLQGSLSGELAFPRTTSSGDSAYLPDSAQGTLSLTKTLQGSTQLGMTIGYSFQKTGEEETAQLIQIPRMSFTLNQGLKPWWAQGARIEPQWATLKADLATAEYEYLDLRRSKINQLAELWIRLRTINRTHELSAEALDLWQADYSVQSALVAKGVQTQAGLWERELAGLDLQAELDDLEAQTQGLVMELRALTGLDAGDVGAMPLPALTQQSTMVSDFAQDALRGRLTRLEHESVLLQQAHATRLTLGAGVTWFPSTHVPDSLGSAGNEFGQAQWSLSLGLDLSPLWSAEARRDLLLLETRERELTQRLEAQGDTDNVEVQSRRTRLVQLEARLERDRQGLARMQESLESYTQLLSQGRISSLEWRQFDYTFKKRTAAIQNLEDQVWLARFVDSDI